MQGTMREFGGCANVFAWHRSAIEIAQEFLKILDMVEQELADGGREEVFDVWLRGMPLYPRRGWVRFARSYVACGKDRQKHAAKLLRASRRAFDELASALERDARQAGFYVQRPDDLTTLLLDLDLRLPFLAADRVTGRMSPDFQLLRSAQELEISEYGPAASTGQRSAYAAPSDEASANHRRRQEVALAHLVRQLALRRIRADREAARVHDATQASVGAAVVLASPVAMTEQTAHIDGPPTAARRCAPNRTPPKELKKRRAEWEKIRNYYGEAASKGVSINLEEAGRKFNMSFKRYKTVAQSAQREGWSDPADEWLQGSCAQEA